MSAKNYAIMIGISDYNSRPLNHSAKDVDTLKAALISNCKFEEEDIKTIISRQGEQIWHKRVVGI